ncbi:heterokaryon incompatibility protein-domain-containing protein [Podospora australis]|uniref:Heterokaryon incompatibility protein-domain-containing protein n=1 Tax=Podospora australis TaxID=1536484 RepID=A0AAN6X1A3_9PEZI|nr:heterokaryon incompatibility protein-domain-containing protein [Podospora australis]
MYGYLPSHADRGDPNCGLCISMYQERWSSLPEIQGHAEDGCPYCANMLEGLLYLIPDLIERFGEDATFRFERRRDMSVYADPNGSLRHTQRNATMKLQYRWYMIDSPQGYEPDGDTSSENSFSRARGWIQECLTNHKLCGNDEPSPLPTRVLDLGEAVLEGGEPEVRLVETAADQKGRYIALSHSWGGEHPLVTKTSNLDSHKAGIPLVSMPATFQDAVEIARRLGIRCLWIDSLCIIQDSPADWELEASRMANIYRNSWLTVYATASSSPSSGIFRTRQAVWIQADDPEDAETLDILFPEAAKLRHDLRLSLRFANVHPDFSPYAEPDKQKSSLPLLARAWAYQERLLAPRVLHFGPQEVFWECMQTLDCDCGGIKLRPEHMGSYMSRDTTAELPPKVSHYAALHVGKAASQKSKTQEEKRRKKLLARWQEMVEEYTHRSLTFSSDRLPAFSGVAMEMVEALGGWEYHAGQWKETMLLGLLYQRSDGHKLARLSIADTRPAPSWSWASVDGPVRFLVSLSGAQEWAAPVAHANVLEVRSVPAGSDVRGQVKLGESYVVLSAECVRVMVLFERDAGMVPGKPWKGIGYAVEKGIKGPTAAEIGLGSFAVAQEGHFQKKKKRKEREEPLTFVPDVQLCDADGKWLWKGEEEVLCAKMLESGNAVYWLVLRKVSPGEAKEGEWYERIGVANDYDSSWEASTAEREHRSVKIV